MKSELKNIGLSVLVFLTCAYVNAQDDLVSTEEMIVEQQNINFQTFFFEALQQKAIENYDKAIYALEACHDIDKENEAVLFELSKNYAYQFKFTEAEYYAYKGLELDPRNLYMLRHLKEIKTKQNDFNGAIAIQRRIVEQAPEEESDLVILYIKSGEIDQAIDLLKKLDSLDKVPEGLVALKESLLQENSASFTPSDLEEQDMLEEEIKPDQNLQLSTDPKSKNELLSEAYYSDKSFKNLIPLLERELKTKQFLDLLKHSEDGISLFPAQPIMYLMNGTALNHLRKYDEALGILNQGLDYLLDDPLMELQFMEQMSLSYKGMGDNKKASEYYNKAIELKNE